MPRRVQLFIALLLLAPTLAHAQATSLRGHFKDAETGAPVLGVQVKLTSVSDTSDVYRVTASDYGTFVINGPGSAQLPARGHAPGLRDAAHHGARHQGRPGPGRAGAHLALDPDAARRHLGHRCFPAVQKADTTEFHASAVKHQPRTPPPRTWCRRCPGVTMENGQIKAQGEQVQNVLVNGKPFFGSDPTAAMRNLPAEVVDRIQVYDKMSDQAEFSGFDDGQSQKTMNFILRDRKSAVRQGLRRLRRPGPLPGRRQRHR